jgi:hypothetical protein
VRAKENKSKERPRIYADVLNKFRAYISNIKKKRKPRKRKQSF